MHKMCLVFWQSEPQYAYKRYDYKSNIQKVLFVVIVFFERMSETGLILMHHIGVNRRSHLIYDTF